MNALWRFIWQNGKFVNIFHSNYDLLYNPLHPNKIHLTTKIGWGHCNMPIQYPKPWFHFNVVPSAFFPLPGAAVGDMGCVRTQWPISKINVCDSCGTSQWPVFMPEADHPWWHLYDLTGPLVTRRPGSWQFNSSSSAQNGRRFADDIFKCIYMKAKFCILIRISLNFDLKGPIEDDTALV